MRLPISRFSWPALFALAIGALTAPAFAQSPASTVPAYRGRILGVFDAQTGDPIEGADISDVLNKNSSVTTKTGTVSLVFLPDGGTLVRIRKIGYETQTMMVAISPADTVPLTVLMARSAQTLPTVVTRDSAPPPRSMRLRDFVERMNAGAGGRFISEADLRKNDGKTNMTNMIRRLSGLQVQCGKPGGQRPMDCWAITRRAQSRMAIMGGECAVDLYMDGVPYSDNDLNKLKVEEFAGVEYYAGGASIPIQYNKTGSSCGVLLLWTRER
jgi:hypothetical protein